MDILFALYVAAASHAAPGVEATPWVNMSTAEDTGVYLDTRSVTGTGASRKVFAVIIKWRTHPRQSRATQFEMDCSTNKYREVGQGEWLNDDPANVQRVCNGDFGGLPEHSDEDLTRWRKGGAIFSGKQGAQLFADMFTGRLIGTGSGSALVRWCAHSKTECGYYLDGFYEGMVAGGSICRPNTPADRVQAVVTYIGRLRQAEREGSVSTLLARHFKEAYPCR